MGEIECARGRLAALHATTQFGFRCRRHAGDRETAGIGLRTASDWPVLSAGVELSSEDESRLGSRKQSMSEDHQIVGESRGEPLPAGRVGVRVRLKLSGCPSPRWSSALGANLYKELVGDTAVGHLRLDEIVQGDEIVLDGVEESEAPTLATTLRRAVDATNEMVASKVDSTANVAQERADGIARQVDSGLGT